MGNPRGFGSGLLTPSRQGAKAARCSIGPHTNKEELVRDVKVRGRLWYP